jgi:hypothetical protein
MAELSENLKSRIAWAINPFHNGLTIQVKKTETQTVKQLRDSANKAERNWGNSVIGQISNGNWTTNLGETLVKETLEAIGHNVRKPQKRNGYQPDWETDDAIWEVKTRNWTTSGTAGEKVLGVIYKYSDIPILYGKPLKIVCVAYQEWELTHGNTKIFGDVSENKRAILNLAQQMEIKYVKFSDLVQSIP